MTCFVTFFQAMMKDCTTIYFDWLNDVYDEVGLPCECKIKGRRTRGRVNGCFHHSRGARKKSILLSLPVF